MATVSREEWRAAVGFNGLVEVSSLGRVRNARTGLIRKLNPDKDGYPRLSLRRDSRGRGEAHLVHKLVCEAFHGPRPADRPEVAHRDGIRSNCAASNVRWATRAENVSDKFQHGSVLGGERHPRAKLTGANVADILARLSEPAADLANQYGVTVCTIQEIWRGKRWAAPSSRKKRNG